MLLYVCVPHCCNCLVISDETNHKQPGLIDLTFFSFLNATIDQREVRQETPLESERCSKFGFKFI